MKPITAVVLGAGSRGSTYARYAKDFPGELQIVAVAEPREDRRKLLAEELGCDWVRPGADGEMPKASVALEINVDHPIKEKLFTLYKNDPEMLKKYARILYSEACLISGLSLENPAELCELISELLVK